VIVTLEDGLFADKSLNPLLLLSIFRHGFEGRHIVLTDPLYPAKGSHLEAWLKARDADVGDLVIEALDRSRKAYGNVSTVMEVRVENRQQSQWTSTPPLLAPDDAALLMALPLHLVLEDRLSDKYFLLCVLPRPKRAELQRALAQGWCRAENGGGLGNMRRYIESLKDEPAERLRTWFLFDRDTEASGDPSRQSLLLKTDCERHSLPHHQLSRRSIENYLPPIALDWWSGRFRRNEYAERRDLVQGFKAMTPEQRHHCDMKERFGSHIAELFREEHFDINPSWLDNDHQRPELDLIMKALFERM
jgi:hypothetical protein